MCVCAPVPMVWLGDEKCTTVCVWLCHVLVCKVAVNVNCYWIVWC